MNAHSASPLLVAPPPVSVGGGGAAGASAPPAAAASPAPVLSKKQLKAAAARERERERAALEAQREAAAAAAAAAAASSSSGAARSSGGGNRSDRDQRPRHYKDDQSSHNTGNSGGGGGGGGQTRKHERHASSSSSAGAAGGSSGAAASAGGGGSSHTPRYTKGLPSQYASSSPAHASNHSNATPAAAASAAATPASTAKPPPQSFQHPPSLFRYHSRKPVPFVLPPSSAAPPLSSVPPFYAPTNLLRLMRSLTPKLRRDFTLGDLWEFYDLPYGHDIDVLLDPHQLLHGAATQQHQHHHHAPASLLHAMHAQPEGTEVYYVPYLSALVLYERALPGVDPAVAESAPPLLQWFERVSPHQRMPLPDSIGSIGSCFSPAPSSPLYDLFRPFPSRTILHELGAHQLDTRRSWYAITWYPILHDPLSSPFLAGAFLLYHGFQTQGETTGANHGPRACPMQESTFRGVAEVPVAVPPVTNGRVPAAAVSTATPMRARPPLSDVGSSDVDGGLTTAGEEEEEAGDDADGETEESEVEGSSAAPGTRRRQRRGLAGTKAAPPPFPPHLCPHCGDKHGPPVAPPSLPTLVHPATPAPPAATAASVGADASSSSSAAAASLPPPLGYLPLLGYMCHRVLPSTWYVQAYQPPPSTQQMHPNSLQQQQQQQQQSQSQSQPSAPGVRNGGDPAAAPGVQLKQQQQHLQQQQHQLECVSSFNAALHTPAAFTHLSLSQPARLTHVDLSLSLHESLQRTQHPDFLHMTATQTLQ